MADSTNLTFTYSNTFSNKLTTDFNVTPYYDDYDARNNYYRMLFKPGYAVQARELTQMQTMMQAQVSRIGKNVFKEGSIVIPGSYTFKTNAGDKKSNPIDYVKIKNTDWPGNNTITIANYDGQIFIGAQSNVSAYVQDVLDTDGTTSNTKTLYVTYLNASQANSSIRTFIPGEVLTSNVGTAVVLNSDPVANTGYSSWFQIDEGVFFAKEHFIYFPTQKVVLDRYNPNPTCRVGFYVDEQIINFSTDASLLDPALESSNYAAPGSDRLKLVSTLSVVPYDYTNSPDFVTLFTIKNGVLQTNYEKTQFNVIGKEIADRTYEESGDYVVKGLNVQILEHDRFDTPVPNNGRYDTGNNSLLIARIDPGHAYVKGYSITNYGSEEISFVKPTDIKNVTSAITSTSMGQYLTVNEFVGSWQLDKGNRINLYDTPQKRITNGGQSTAQKWSTGAQTGKQIGSAIYNTVQYVSGVPGYDAKYNIFLSDVKMLGSNTFANVRSVYSDVSTVADLGGDVFGATDISTNTVLNDLNKGPLLYYTGSNYTKTVLDTSGNPQVSYFFNKTAGIDSSISLFTDGTLTVPYGGGANELLPYGTGTTVLSDTDVSQDIIVTCLNSMNISLGVGTVYGSGNNLSGSSTAFTNLNVGDKIEISGKSNTWYITAIANSTFLTVNSPLSGVNGNTLFKAYKAGDIIDFTGKGVTAGVDRTVTSTSGTSLTFNMRETLPSSMGVTVSYKLSTTNTLQASKTLRPNAVVGISTTNFGTSGPYCLGYSDVYKVNKIVRKVGGIPSSFTDGDDVTRYFRLDNGQRDTFYDLANIIKSSSLTLAAGDGLLASLDYFFPSYSSAGGFFTKDSYSIQDNDALVTYPRTTIRTENIPIFVSPTSGASYDLRNYIDFRPVKTSTATYVIDTVTNNPSNTSTTYVSSASAMKFPVPSDPMIYGYSYYLGRKDIVVVNSDGNFAVVTGVPSENPITPDALETQMLLSILNIAPYPSLSPAYGNNLGRKDLACSAKKVSNRRYTMRDIGVLDSRISNLEYYTSLTMLEKDALSLKILDDNMQDRFKNGIFIDTFKDTSLSAKGVDRDFRIVTDPNELCIRPLFSTHSLAYEYISGSGTGVKVHDDDIITLDYTETTHFAQTRVTDTRNLERGTFFFQGNIALFPPQDVWIDTSYAADEQVGIVVKVPGTISTDNGATEALIDISVSQGADVTSATKASFSKNFINTEWENWKAKITGYKIYSGAGASKKYIGTYTTEEEARQAAAAFTTTQFGGDATIQTQYYNQRLGTSYYANQDSDSEAGSNKLVSSAVIPYMRPIVITAKAQGLKPFSKMNAFFDDTNVSAYCTPLTLAQFTSFIAGTATTTTSAEGSSLIVDQYGNLYFNFRVTDNGPRFRTGERRLALIDGEQIAPLNIATEEDASTAASAWFFASGTSQRLQKTIYSTRSYLKTAQPAEEHNNEPHDDGIVIPNSWVPPQPVKNHCCFDPNAKILMADLSYKAIKDIVPGDKVMGYHGSINTVIKNKTIGVGIRKMIKFKDTSFYTTDDHIFLTKKGWKTWRPDIVLNSPDTSNGQYLIGENRECGIGKEDELKIIDIVDGQVIEKFVPYTSLEAETVEFDPNYIVHDLTLDGNMTYIVEGFIVHNCCVAYTVLIRAPADEEGVFITSFDIFVARKSATRGMWFEVRECDNSGFPTTSPVPGTKVKLENSAIVESANGQSNPVNVKFTSPVFLFNNKEYAFIVHSDSPNQLSVDPDTSLWISRLGEFDKNSRAKVNERQGTGQFFQTTNNRLWDPVKDVDLTINIYRAKFTSGSGGAFEIGNEPLEKVIMKDVTASLSNRVGDYFSSGDTLTLTGATGTIYTGNTLRGNISTTSANGYVISIPSANKYMMSNTRYSVGERVFVYNNGTNTGINGIVTTVANTTAKLAYYDESSSVLYAELTGSTGGLTANMNFQNMTVGGFAFRANVASIDNFTYSAVSFEPKSLDFIKTDLKYEMQTYANGSTSVDSYIPIHESETQYFNQSKAVYSRTNEINSLSSGRSNKVRVTMSSLSDYVSPVFDIGTSHTILIDNLINANTSGETARSGGQALNKYISQTVSLADGQEAEDLKVYLTAYRPPATDVKVYLKLIQAGDSEILTQKSWIELEKDSNGDGTYSSLSDRFNFKEFVYKIPDSYMTGPLGEVQYTTTTGSVMTGFKYFAVKIVLTSTNSAIVPRVADLRCIALQI